MKEIVLDTETTGLSVKDGHRIVEIGCIELDNLIPTKNVFHCYLNPERKVSESALKVHGYTDIHNADFDISHLNNELSLINKKTISKENVIDTLEIARNKFPGAGISLDALCKRFRVDNTRRKTHTALLDCELLSKVYINLIDQKEPIFQFKKQIDLGKVNLNNHKKVYSKKIIKISKEEFELHKIFLKKQLKKNFY